jgi:glyoxylase-like metal-dependent hydrolase (beta-lactamase superfamily II)
MLQWDIGEARISAIVEQPLDDLNGLIQQATPQNLSEIGWLNPHFMDEDGTLLGVVQCFVIEIAGQLLVVDTCVGDHKDLPSSHEWNRKVFGLFEKFEAAGFAASDVDYVFCTHLHLDHVGMNTLLVDGAFKPTFPNARYLFAREEFDFWKSEYDRPEVNPDTLAKPFEKMRATFHKTQKNVHDQSVQPVFDAGLAELVDIPCEPVAGVRLIPTPGHTPGHISIEISSRGQRAIITGDSFHHPCQIARADWGTFADIDRNRGAATRAEMLAAIAGTDTLLIGSHFSAPTGGTIVADGDSYRLKIDE